MIFRSVVIETSCYIQLKKYSYLTNIHFQALYYQETSENFDLNLDLNLVHPHFYYIIENRKQR